METIASDVTPLGKKESEQNNEESDASDAASDGESSRVLTSSPKPDLPTIPFQIKKAQPVKTTSQKTTMTAVNHSQLIIKTSFLQVNCLSSRQMKIKENF